MQEDDARRPPRLPSAEATTTATEHQALRLPSSPAQLAAQDLPTVDQSLSFSHPTPDRFVSPSSSWRTVTEAGFSPSSRGPRPAGFLGPSQRWASPWAPGAAAGPLPGVRKAERGQGLGVTVAVAAVVAALVGGLVGGAVSGFGAKKVVRRVVVERPSISATGSVPDFRAAVERALPSVVGVIGPSGRSGSGVVVARETIVAPATLVARGSTVRLAVPGRAGLVPARVLGVVRSSDVAVLRLEKPLRLHPLSLPPATTAAVGSALVVVSREATGASSRRVSVVEGRVVDPTSAYLLHGASATAPLVGLIEANVPIGSHGLGALALGTGGRLLGMVSVVGPASNLPGAPTEAFIAPPDILRRALKAVEAGGQASRLLPPLS